MTGEDIQCAADEIVAQMKKDAEDVKRLADAAERIAEALEFAMTDGYDGDTILGALRSIEKALYKGLS